MNTLIAVVLTVMASPANVANNAPVSLTPETTITFSAKTEKLAMAQCVRVEKALSAAQKISFCGDVETPTADASK